MDLTQDHHNQHRHELPTDTVDNPGVLPAPERQSEGTATAGLALLEDDGQAITVAAFAGERYHLASEMARVRIELDADGTGTIAELKESPPARGSLALSDALGQAEAHAWQRGTRRLECRISEAAFARLDPTERRDIARALQERGYLFRGAPGRDSPAARAYSRTELRSVEASKLLDVSPRNVLRPGEPTQAIKARWAEAAQPAPERELEPPPGLQIIAEDDHSITVAAFAGERYNLAGEVARVHLELGFPGDLPVANVTELRLDDLSACGACKDTLDLAVARARQRGIQLVELKLSEEQFTRLSIDERRGIVHALQEDWSLVVCETRLANGERRFVVRAGEPAGQGEVPGEPLWLNAKKDLTAEHPPVPEQLNETAAMRFRAELAEARDGRPPGELHLPPGVEERLEELWRWSLSEPERPEWAATLVVNESGELVAAHPVTGQSGGVNPEAPQTGETLVGYLHTHPYESGLTDMAFSGQDLASFLGDKKDQIEIVRSGDGVFALVKTADTSHIRWPWVKGQIVQKVDNDFAIAYESITSQNGDGRSSDLAAQNALIAVNQEMCARYGIALYAGRAGRPLQRVYP